MRRFWKCLALFGPAAAKLLNWTPALIREASQLLTFLASSLQVASAGFAKRKQYEGVPLPLLVLNHGILCLLLTKLVVEGFAHVTTDRE